EFYQANTKPIKSLDDLYKNRYRLVDSVTGDATKDAMSEEAMNLAYKEARNVEKYGDSMFAVEDAAKYLSSPGVKTDLPFAQSQLDDLIAAYREVPVSYFEAKPRRVVRGDEFHAAFIPDDSSPEVMAHLERLGVKNIQKYLDKGDLDLSLAKLAKEGKRGTSPYVLGLGGALPTAGVLGSMFSGGSNQEQA
ncbi:MAG: hypothetical protein KDA17_08285, partial [Candidatus Saccharibacteria bacterium]|nr:hypothetical protein [Candidatus Saccharibacteria bacterium]